MKTNKKLTGKHYLLAKQTEKITIDLQYLSADQAKHLIEMFDSPEVYAENFSAIKAIASGLFNLILETKPNVKSPIGRMFHTVNEIQGMLMRDNMEEHFRIIDSSGLMPDPWSKFRSQKGAEPCV